ncbi:MAG: cobalamin-dependent protein [Candidatus Omnitrophica bacterium]|nr:cobalamin-dependent protein [Candidatus Omnitrophota bacterium]
MSTNSLLISISGVPKIFSDFLPDNGLAILAACLEDNSHNVMILDYNTPDTLELVFEYKPVSEIRKIAEKIFIYKRRPNIIDLAKLKIISRRLEEYKKSVFDGISNDICRIVKENDIDFVGIKLWAGEGFMYSLLLAEKLKREFPKIKIFGGGPQVDIFQEEIFRITDNFDALCLGDGEETIVLLADFVRGKVALDSVPNVIFKKNGSIVKTERRFITEFEKLPFPEYRKDVYIGVDNKVKMFVLDESRGCNNHCAFCIHPVKSGKLRKKPVGKILREIEYSLSTYGTKLFRYAGSSTPADLLEITAKKILEKDLKIAYTCFGNFEAMKNADFNLIRSSGCMAVFFGLESGSPEILEKAFHKKNSLVDVEHVMDACKKAGIFTVVSVIYPAPFETETTKRQTIEFLTKIKPDSVLVQFPGLYPRTVWGRNPEKFNFTLETDTYELDIMTYQIKQFFPPRYWKPLPYRVNGMRFRQYAAETERFQKELNSRGFLTFVSDEAYLLSKCAGFENPSEFIDKNRFYLFAGLADEIRKEIKLINSSMI